MLKNPLFLCIIRTQKTMEFSIKIFEKSSMYNCVDNVFKAHKITFADLNQNKSNFFIGN